MYLTIADKDDEARAQLLQKKMNEWMNEWIFIFLVGGAGTIFREENIRIWFRVCPVGISSCDLSIFSVLLLSILKKSDPERIDPLIFKKEQHFFSRSNLSYALSITKQAIRSKTDNRIPSPGPVLCHFKKLKSTKRFTEGSLYKKGF